MPHIRQNNTRNEKSSRIAELSEQEQTAYKWLYEGYSETWTAETLGLTRSDARKVFKSIYQKLGVDNQSGIIEYYAQQEVSFF